MSKPKTLIVALVLALLAQPAWVSALAQSSEGGRPEQPAEASPSAAPPAPADASVAPAAPGGAAESSPSSPAPAGAPAAASAPSGSSASAAPEPPKMLLKVGDIVAGKNSDGVVRVMKIVHITWVEGDRLLHSMVYKEQFKTFDEAADAFKRRALTVEVLHVPVDAEGMTRDANRVLGNEAVAENELVGYKDYIQEMGPPQPTKGAGTETPAPGR